MEARKKSVLRGVEFRRLVRIRITRGWRVNGANGAQRRGNVCVCVCVAECVGKSKERRGEDWRGVGTTDVYIHESK